MLRENITFLSQSALSCMNKDAHCGIGQNLTVISAVKMLHANPRKTVALVRYIVCLLDLLFVMECSGLSSSQSVFCEFSYLINPY